MLIFKEHFDSILTVGVTILGFIITYLKTKKDLKNELIKNKQTINAEVIKELPYEVCELLNKMIANKSSSEELSKTLSKVLAYGSKNAVNIAINMQRLAYSNADSSNKQVWMESLASYSLLITQIKYDLTSEIISPESWFKIKITDYSDLQTEIKPVINNIIDKLNLNDKFKV